MAAAAVAKIDPAQTGPVIPALVNALNSDDAPLQGAAADELGALGNHAEPALPVLLKLLGDDCAAVRTTAAQAIWQITGDRTPAKQVGLALLRSEDWLDRQIGGSLLVLLGAERRRGFRGHHTSTRVPGTPYLIIIVSYVWCPRNPVSPEPRGPASPG